ncbi:Ribonucleases P/MRP protein subunit pop1 [Savitreella phatthalungensis]
MAAIKRKADEMSDAALARRNKIRSARNIATQSASPALRAGAIPVQEFLNARRFEINSMLASLDKAKEASSNRAFQTLPRYLRRRAASHNVKRVPKRLRDWARQEMKDTDVQRPAKRVPFGRKRGRRDTIRRLKAIKIKLEAYQRDARAFEPAKLPGTSLPAVKPLNATRFANRQRNKTWLPSHLWQAKRARMANLWGFSIAQNPNEKTYRSTHRTLHHKGCIVFDTSYLAHILLRGPAEQLVLVLKQICRSEEVCGARAQKGRKIYSTELIIDGKLCGPIRILWSADESVSILVIQLHPTIHLDAWHVITQLKQTSGMKQIKMDDLRFQLGSVQVYGPTAISAVLSCLKVKDASTEAQRLYKNLHGLQPTEAPQNMVLPVEVVDPRPAHAFQLITEPPKADIAALEEACRTTPPSKLLNLRQLVGINTARPEIKGFKAEDAPAIPIILIGVPGGVSILAPWSYTTDIWYALNHVPLVRFGGQRELAQIFYEQAQPFFPTDYIGTRAGNDAHEEARRLLQAQHDRRPPAKRVNFAKSLNGGNELGDPFKADLAYLYGHTTALEKLGKVTKKLAKKHEQPNGMNDPTAAAEAQTANNNVQPDTALPLMLEQLEQKTGPAPHLVSGQHFLQMLQDNMEKSLESAVVLVRIKMIDRGCPQHRARLYSAPDPTDLVKDNTRLRKDLVGFVTTGNFSLSHGRGIAVGVLRADFIASSLKNIPKQQRQHATHPNPCIIRNVGTSNFHRATWTLIK